MFAFVRPNETQGPRLGKAPAQASRVSKNKNIRCPSYAKYCGWKLT